MRWSLLLVTACGRLGFASQPDAQPDAGPDAPPDVLTGHDEDGDGLADAIDPCPYTPGDSADQDGDGVGDACDPHPTTPGDHWTFFSPCTPDRPPPFSLETFTQGADSVTSSDFSVQIAGPIAQTRIAIGFAILARRGTDQHQVALGAESVPFYFAEVNDNYADTVHDVGAVYANQQTNQYDVIGIAPLDTDVHLGSAAIIFDLDVAGQRMAIDAGWGIERYVVSAPVPGAVPAPSARFQTNGIDIELYYAAMITTD